MELDPYPHRNIYHESQGRNLLNPEKYPEEVKAYLQKEKQILSQLKPHFKVLVEVGCFDGTYLQFCHRHRKKYIGIDINLEYLEEGKHKADFFNTPTQEYEFHNLNAQNLHEIKSASQLFQSTPKEEILVMFPFNCLGNIPNVQSVIDSLNTLGLAYFISNFNTTNEATKVREQYYGNCDYDTIIKRVDNDGVRFTSIDGLNSVAYDLNFLITKFIHTNTNTQMIHINGIGIGLLNLNRYFNATNLITT